MDNIEKIQSIDIGSWVTMAPIQYKSGIRFYKTYNQQHIQRHLAMTKSVKTSWIASIVITRTSLTIVKLLVIFLFDWTISWCKNCVEIFFF